MIRWPKEWEAREGWAKTDETTPHLENEPRTWQGINSALNHNSGMTLLELRVALGGPGRRVPAWESISPHLHRLTSREAELLTFAIRDRKTQAEIATYQRMSQPAVSHAYKTALRRLAAFSPLPALSKTELMRDCQDTLSKEDIDILWRLYTTPSQLAVAEELGITQGKVRYRLVRAVHLLQSNRRFAKYHTVYKAILTGSIRAASRWNKSGHRRPV